MKKCKSCGAEFPSQMMVDGKQRNFQRRKYCLSCSPFGSGNRKKLSGDPEQRPLVGSRKFRRWQRKARKERKAALVEMLGGSCNRCGYDKCNRALDFHHKDPATKRFSISNYGMCRKWDDLVAEVKKCELLCRNCHAEIEDEKAQHKIAGVAQLVVAGD